MSEQFRNTWRERQASAYKLGRTGALNVALLFGTAAILLSLVLTPLLAKRSDSYRLSQVRSEFDRIVTGSVGNAQSADRVYTIRRSILQESPESVCVVQGYAAGKDC